MALIISLILIIVVNVILISITYRMEQKARRDYIKSTEDLIAFYREQTKELRGYLDELRNR